MIGRADQQNRPASFTWQEFNKYIKNAGLEEFDYDSFKMAYDADPVIQALANEPNKNGVELKTKQSNNDTAPSDAEPDRDSVKTAAARATKNARG